MTDIRSDNVILDGGIVVNLRQAAADVFSVSEVKIPPHAVQGTIIFSGKLLNDDSEIAYDTIAQRWQPLQYTPMLRWGKTPKEVELVAQPGLIDPKPGNPLINLILFLVTLVSVLVVGALNEGADLLNDPLSFTLGLPFALSFLAILLAHEFGHYFAAKYHKVAVTLPYFIPFPTIWGTFGAFIQLRSPTLNKRQLFDVGVAGPLAGLAVAVPVLFAGLMMSHTQPLPVGEAYMLEGNSVFYWLSKYLVFHQTLPANGVDVFLHPLAWAGWSGLLVTAFNLFPVGQLDGGHVAYVLFGKYAKRVGYVVVAAMVAVGIFFWQGWLFWALMIFFIIGTGHPPPLNELAPLGIKRKILGYAVIVIFVLLFTPNPLQVVGF